MILFCPAMKYLFRHWDRIKKGLSGKGIFLFLDYDGTLTPITKVPKDAVMSQENRSLLEKLSCKSDCRLAIISGRALSDVKKRFGIKGIIYAGNHGLEIEGPRIRFTAPISYYIKKAISGIEKKMKFEYLRFKGVFVEDKGLTVSVHYRLADKKDFISIKNIFNKYTAPYVDNGKIRIGMGKRVFEIRPNIKWDKGRVADWLMTGHGNSIPIYIGDDITDEDAFKMLKGKGVTVFVGTAKKSNAEYYLKDTEEVTELLRRIYGTI